MNCTRPEGNQGRAKVYQDLLDPHEPQCGFGATKEVQKLFWKYWLSLCSAAFARGPAHLSSTDKAQGL